MRDHGGDLDRAIREHGAGHWLDLSTGINAKPYPLPSLPDGAWAMLPTRKAIAETEHAAAGYYRTAAPVVALAGAQAAIQLVPRLVRPGRACIVGPTYNEHAAALRAQGWDVDMVSRPEDGAGADLVTVVNPNNPDGRNWQPETLLNLRDRVGLLVVDESFADTEPGVSVASRVSAQEERIVVLRSFGKFFGLAGLRLGFAITGERLADRLRALAGPWAVNGPAIAVAREALADRGWQDATRTRLAAENRRMDALAARAGWRPVGGTALFRTFDTPDAQLAQEALARHHVWSRVFPYSDGWLRLGFPGSPAGWAQLEAAMAAV